MAKQLIKFHFKNTGANKAFNLDTSQSLAEIRIYLSGLTPPLMSSKDTFWFDEAIIDISQEAEMTLSNILPEAPKTAIVIGISRPIDDIDPEGDVDRYNLLTENQKRGIFENIELLRGLCLTADGFKKSFKNVFEFEEGYMPQANQPSAVTQKSSHTHFSKTMNELTISGSESISAELDTPFVSAEAEYKHEQSKTTTSTQTTQYMTERFLVNKVDLNIEESQIKVNTEFVDAVRTAMIGSKDNEWAAFNRLVEVLNKWGYYIRLEFSLGGVLYANETEKIKEFSESEKKSQEFSGKFKAKLGSIGAGGAYSKAQGEERKNSSETKDTSINLLQIGGKPFDTREETYETWFTSLEKAISWGITRTEKMLPTLYLLTQTDDVALLGRCLRLIDKCSGKSSALQPYLSMSKYSASIANMVNQFD